tara:strand:- start:938 stop:1183 length:246 start_codon:yes stop_codon:yes gene_type:complete
MNDIDAWPEGRTIVQIRPVTEKDMELHGFEFNKASGLVLVLDDDSTLIPSMDEEGNGCGVMFGERDDQSLCVIADWVIVDE